MSKKEAVKPKRWKESDRAIKATQVAFDVENRIIEKIKTDACHQGVAPSDMIRYILGLTVTVKPVRPRLTMSLKEEDYQILAEKYGLKANEKLAIKARIIDEIRAYAEDDLE